MTIFFAADHHLQHANIIKFRDENNGKFLRGQFGTIEEHDEHIINRHNAVVKDDDTVYMMGDVTWKTNARTKSLLTQLKGRLELVIGNHDHVKFLIPYFDDFHMWKYMPDESIIVSHVPLSNDDVKRSGFNVHGHIHQKAMLLNMNGQTILDPRYMCVSMEQIDYTPVPLDLVLRTRAALVANYNKLGANADGVKG